MDSDSESDDQDEECAMYEDNEHTCEESKANLVDQHVPHRLSVIREDSPKTERNMGTEEFPDDDSANTVSVSLPLRFRFSVSENNQDVTTLIVGDSTIQQTEMTSSKDDDEIHVDFTLRRKKQTTPDTDLPHGIHEIENDENIKTKFSVSATRTDIMKQIAESEYKNPQMFYESRVSDVVYDLATCSEVYSTSDNYHSSLGEVYHLPLKQIERDNEKIHTPENDDVHQDPEENSSRSKSKNLLSVQNSKEETDDEDSGVTSDMSRIISEVDTDSECCTVTRKQSKYQRTQTHSRLFRLLNNDSNSHQEDRSEHLYLQLQSVAPTDDHYCSNLSSGMTSPEYSPVYEADKSTQDCYYQTWKSSKSDNDLDILPSMAHKVLDSQKPHWTYKVNVLCPRIRSSKNVPNDLKTTSECCVNPLTLSSPKDPLRNSQC